MILENCHVCIYELLQINFIMILFIYTYINIWLNIYKIVHLCTHYVYTHVYIKYTLPMHKRLYIHFIMTL